MTLPKNLILSNWIKESNNKNMKKYTKSTLNKTTIATKKKHW